jgi:hypothetical protein
MEILFPRLLASHCVWMLFAVIRQQISVHYLSSSSENHLFSMRFKKVKVSKTYNLKERSGC